MTAGGSTTTHGLPWPDGAAAADGSADIKALAEATERELVEHDALLATEVVAGTAQPTFVADGIWADTTAPVVSVTIPDYVDAAGDTMSGPLVVPVPTLITQVGRWAEGLPRFATIAEADAAYASIGGSVEGMERYVAALKQTQRYDGSAWVAPGAWGPLTSGTLGAWTGVFSFSSNASTIFAYIGISAGTVIGDNWYTVGTAPATHLPSADFFTFPGVTSEGYACVFGFYRNGDVRVILPAVNISANIEVRTSCMYPKG